MKDISQTPPAPSAKRSMGIKMIGILLASLIMLTLIWRSQNTGTNTKNLEIEAIQVLSTVVSQNDVLVKLSANGTVSAQQTVDVRPQISATMKMVHIREGQFVNKGDKLFTLDARTENANLNKAEAQLVKSHADLLNAERNLKRQQELFQQKFISQSALDIAQNQVDGLRGQFGFDKATVQANRVMQSFSEIYAPISGRTGVIPVYPGSLVQPNSAVIGSLIQPSSAILVSITQIDPINISFTLPERELATLQQAFTKGEISVSAELDLIGGKTQYGKLLFIDNTIDVASGSIRLKAEFPNAERHLWPGMFVTVTLAPRKLKDAITVPVQAVQTGPESKFLYIIEENNKVRILPISVRLIQDKLAIIDGAKPGIRVVLEGAQNLRPGSIVTETGNSKNANESLIQSVSNASNKTN